MSNFAIQNTFMVLKLEAYEPDNPFTDAQRKELSDIIERVENIEINLKNITQLPRNLKRIEEALKEYDSKFQEYGGNVKRLEEKLKTVREINRAVVPGYIESVKGRAAVHNLFNFWIKRKEK